MHSLKGRVMFVIIALVVVFVDVYVFLFSCVYIISRSITLYLFQINSIEVVAVVNDAVGTLMSAAHSDQQCEIGLILGQYRNGIPYTLVYKIIIFNVHRNC